MEMKTVIATCSPYGNIEKVLLILHQAGLEHENDAFVRWHDELLGSSGTVDPLGIDQQLLQGSKLDESIVEIFPEAPNAPLLMADSRCLWLLDFWAEKLPEAKFLLFYTRAESALANACLQGIEPKQALESWQAASRKLLKFQRCHRRRALLLDTDAAIRQPQALLDICQRIGLTLQTVPQKTEPEPEQNIVERYLAHHLVANQPEVHSLHAELEASAQPLDDVIVFEMQPLVLFNKQSQRLAQQRRLQQDLNDTVKKLKIAENALDESNTFRQQFQAQKDQLTQARDEQVELNAQQLAKLENVEQAHQALEATTKEITQENELLLLQLHQVQEELEKIFLQKQQLEQPMQQLVKTAENETNQELQHTKEELLRKEREVEKYHQRESNFKQSVSWKITAPMRAIAKPFEKLSKEKLKTKEQIKLLRTCGLFDEAWYAATNEDVVKAGHDPVEHYVLYGAAEGRDPSPLFSTQGYLEINPDVADTGMNPLVHYIKYGMAEQRSVGSSE